MAFTIETKNSTTHSLESRSAVDTYLLMETGDRLLLETSDRIILEESIGTGTAYTLETKNTS